MFSYLIFIFKNRSVADSPNGAIFAVTSHILSLGAAPPGAVFRRWRKAALRCELSSVWYFKSETQLHKDVLQFAYEESNR